MTDLKEHGKESAGKSAWSRALESFGRSIRRRILLPSNVEGLVGTGVRSTGAPVVDRFSHVLSVQYYAEETGVFFSQRRRSKSGLGHGAGL